MAGSHNRALLMVVTLLRTASVASLASSDSNDVKSKRLVCTASSPKASRVARMLRSMYFASAWYSFGPTLNCWYAAG